MAGVLDYRPGRASTEPTAAPGVSAARPAACAARPGRRRRAAVARALEDVGAVMSEW